MSNAGKKTSKPAAASATAAKVAPAKPSAKEKAIASKKTQAPAAREDVPTPAAAATGTAPTQDADEGLARRTDRKSVV